MEQGADLVSKVDNNMKYEIANINDRDKDNI
jgi:hypothetical protein